MTLENQLCKAVEYSLQQEKLELIKCFNRILFKKKKALTALPPSN